jgi:hypothetical protein
MVTLGKIKLSQNTRPHEIWISILVQQRWKIHSRHALITLVNLLKSPSTENQNKTQLLCFNLQTTLCYFCIPITKCVSDCCLMPNEQYFSIMTRTRYVQWYDDDVNFVQNKHTKFYYYCASSLKQQFMSRHVASLRHNQIPSPPVSYSLILCA